jgi:hypothetical protein
MQITIGDMLNFLESKDPDEILIHGFKNPHSYRGMYDCASVEVADHEVKVSSMIETCRELLSETFFGWKGGEYEYNEDTSLFFAERGRTESFVGYHEYSLEYGSPTDIRIYFYQLIHDVEIKLVY